MSTSPLILFNFFQVDPKQGSKNYFLYLLDSYIIGLFSEPIVSKCGHLVYVALGGEARTRS